MDQDLVASLLASAFEQSTTAQWLCDSQGLILKSNQAMIKWLDSDPSRLKETHLSSWLPDVLPEHLERMSNRTVRSLTLFLPNDKTNPVKATFQPISTATERHYWISLLPVSDVRDPELPLQTLFDSSQDSIAYSLLDGTIQLANPAFLAMLDRGTMDVIGYNYRDFTPEDVVSFEESRIREQLLSNDVSEVYDKRFLRSDGTPVDMSIRLALVRDEQGEPLGVWSVSRDVSMRNQLIESLANSERRFRSLFRTSMDAIGLWTPDHQLQFANNAYLTMTGYTQSELSQLTFHEMTPPGWEDIDTEIAQQVEERGYSDVFEKELLNRDGTIIPVSIRATAVRDRDGGISGSWVIIRDIRAYKRVLNALEHSQNMLEQTNRMARVGGWEYNAQTHQFMLTEESFRILAIPRTYNTSLTNIQKLFSDDAQNQLFKQIGHTLEGGLASDLEIPLDGFEPPRWLRITAQPAIDTQGITYVVGAVQDITEFKNRQQSLEQDRDEFQRMAFHDSLTQLPNRLLLEDRFRQLNFQANRCNGRVAVIVIDLDDFKEINDRHGHPAGDALLRAIANRLTQTVRQSDTVARLGGDEFIILAALDDAEEASLVASKVHEQLQKPIDWEGTELYCSCSLGVALYPEQGDDFSTLYQAADLAMYKAKTTGKNRMEVSDQ
ncbi:diguanylate cyclase domain-containing protein [Saccharospirillum impatiens]|uniref:diguanylate cyclase domain-containing protein n=1 Tax=Saccharospirillum impatiens TaxID=169438 RepID=UPI000400361E|nr:diguanylate cyclase [Saccharospirillum impatiens]